MRLIIKNAKIEWEWVGLRPHREPTRVEKEILTAKNKNKKQIIVSYFFFIVKSGFFRLNSIQIILSFFLKLR
jgi:hypothetical protein